jgi:hypothetical protein
MDVWMHEGKVTITQRRAYSFKLRSLYPAEEATLDQLES